MGAVHSSVERRRIHGGDGIATVPDAQRASGHGPQIFAITKEKAGNTLNTPNKLTIFRILLVPLMVFFLVVEAISSRFLLALCVFIVASITDHLDGKLARKNNQVTDFGKFLDPLADKMLAMSTLICFVELRLVSAVPVIVILLREFIVTSLRLVAISAGKVIAANMWGKIKTATQIASIIVILLSQCVTQSNLLNPRVVHTIYLLNEVFIWLAVAASVYSGYVYVKENLESISLK